MQIYFFTYSSIARVFAGQRRRGVKRTAAVRKYPSQAFSCFRSVYFTLHYVLVVCVSAGKSIAIREKAAAPSSVGSVLLFLHKRLPPTSFISVATDSSFFIYKYCTCTLVLVLALVLDYLYLYKYTNSLV